MRTTILTSSVLSGPSPRLAQYGSTSWSSLAASDHLLERPGRHTYRAELVNSRWLFITGPAGIVQAHIAGAWDNLTLYAFVRGIGFIGGYNAGKRSTAIPWSKAGNILAFSINRGISYRISSDLPEMSYLLRLMRS